MKASRPAVKSPTATPANRGSASNTRVRIAEVADEAGALGTAAREEADRTATEGRNRLQEATAKAGHAAERLATRVAHSAHETAQQLVDVAKEVVGAAKHRRQERAEGARAAAKARK